MAGFTSSWHSYNFKSTIRSMAKAADNKAAISRPPEKTTPPNPSFVEGVATKDVIINDETGLTARMYLPVCAVQPGKINEFGWMMKRMGTVNDVESSLSEQFWQGLNGKEESSAEQEGGGDGGTEGRKERKVVYTGYTPRTDGPNHRLPVLVQFHDGGFVVGSKDAASNDVICRRLARVCNAIVIAVGYRLAPEHKCPAAYDDGYEVLQWLARQALLAQTEMEDGPPLHEDTAAQSSTEERGVARRLVQEMADPWLATHADVGRCILVGVSAGGNIADQVTRRAAHSQGRQELLPLAVVGQVLLYPLFAGSMPTPSELRSREGYFFDRATAELAFRLFLPADDFSLDHPAVNPLLRDQLPAGMPATLLVVADTDILMDRAIAYSVFLRNFGVDSQVKSYKDVVHGFASHETMVLSPQAEACAEDISMWVTKRVASSSKDSEAAY